MSAPKTNISNANHALALEQVNNNVNLSHLISALQTTLNIDELLPLFSTELSTSVNHSGFTFEHDDLKINIQNGQRTNHSCEYSLAIEDTSLGKITFMRRKRFAENELLIIESFLSALLHPLKNTLLYRQAIQSAHTDPLTGVLNRSTLQSVFQKETAQAKRHHSGLSLVMLDIDFFKTVNDNYGHAAGDVALKELTNCIEHTARESDHIFRLGGEEFAILLNSTDLKGADLLAERLRKAVQGISIKHAEHNFNFTVSMGITECNDNDTLENTMNRADKALYEAKESGRNKVVSA
ncbi:MAG TPA: GGDEF domain-containing protein [Cycloclasticus sp.]|nr:GGDEF domain-containing protein [Cycloclasticus sp.]HIL92333.1 GGDEF domain-containing protein [Cycloclasticus sp.]